MEKGNLHDTIERLEKLIHKLEKNLGVPHKDSPLKKAPAKPQAQAQPASAKPQEAKKEAPATEEIAEGGKEAAPKKEGGKKKGGDAPKAPAAAPVDPVLDDFSKCEFRIGEFLQVWKHPDSEKLWCEKINIGREVREIASGLQKSVPIEGMTGLCLVYANLKSKKLGGFPSQGMVMCASDKSVEGEEKIELVRPADGTQIGERVFLDGHEELCPDVAVDASNSKVMERVLEKFKTDAEGHIVYNGIKVRSKTGYLKASAIKNGNVS